VDAERGQRFAHAGGGAVLGGLGPAVSSSAVEEPHLGRGRLLIEAARPHGEGKMDENTMKRNPDNKER